MYKQKELTGRFVVQEHHARNLHYDFRLEIGGVLKSWAVPKNLPDNKGIKRLAVAVEDHPLDYIDFAGVIPAGQYGAGEVKIFDKGGFLLESSSAKKIEFELYGKKFAGKYLIVNFKDNQWLVSRR